MISNLLQTSPNIHSQNSQQIIGTYISEVILEVAKQLKNAFNTSYPNGSFVKYIFETISTSSESAIQSAVSTFNLISTQIAQTIDFSQPAFHFGQNFSLALEKFSYPVVDSLGKVFKRISIQALIHLVPYVALGLFILAAAPLAASYFYKKAVYKIGRPPLAKDAIYTDLYSRTIKKIRTCLPFFSQKEEVELEPVFSNDLSTFLDDQLRYMKSKTKKQKFQNILLYGPAGVGKTLTVKKIAKETGFNYLFMSGGDFAKYAAKDEHVTELNAFFAHINQLSGPTIVHIDEVEALALDRLKYSPDPKRLELLDAFLGLTGDGSTKFVIVATTNRIDCLDKAFLSRMGSKKEIGRPEKEERRKILKQEIQSQEIQAACFNDDNIQQIVDQTEGYSGRELSQLIIQIFVASSQVGFNFETSLQKFGQELEASKKAND